MPRPERAVDASSGPVQRLAVELRRLRAEAGGPTYRELARRCEYSAAVLAEAAGGMRLPGLPVLRAYVGACGGDVAEWEQRWRAASAELAADRCAGAPPDGAGLTPDGRPPYPGLRSFQPADNALFFGRERLVTELTGRLADGGFLIVVGASGSGKSSLLRAGLLPALAADGQTYLLVSPGARPFQAHAAQLAGAAAAGAPVAVDQFEEVFTLCRDGEQRERFVDAVLDAAGRPGARVVATLRADFYGHCAGHPRLAEAVQAGTVLLTAMSDDDLRRAVTGPAGLAGLSVERALVTKVLADAGGRPGALPMVSHALLETWRHRTGKLLSLAGYEATGGVTGAVARTAEQAYAGLGQAERGVARQILTRLTALGEGTQDTRRRVVRAELDLPGAPAVIERLAAARLLVVDGDTVEIAHEALIEAWPRLRGWLGEDRQTLRAHRELTDAAARWITLDRDAGSLYRGVRLAMVRPWVSGPRRPVELTPAEREFVEASLAAESAERAAAARRARQMRAFSYALCVLLALALAAGSVAVWQWRDAVGQRQEALSRQRAAQALGMADRDVAGALTLAVQAYAAAPTVEARGALLSLAGRPAYTGRLPHGSMVKDVAFSPDGATLATSEQSGRVSLWDAARGIRRAELPRHPAAVRALAYTPAGRLVTAGRQGPVLVWDVRRMTVTARLAGQKGLLDSVAVSPDGAMVAAVGEDRRVLLWRASDGAPVGELAGSGGVETDVAFSPDGRRLVSAGDDGTATVWDLATRARVAALNAGPQALHAAAFSPDGRLLATGGRGLAISVWELASGKLLHTLPGHTLPVGALEFTPDGSRLVSGGYDGAVVLWDPLRGQRVTTLRGHTSALYGVAVSPDGRLIAGASRDRTAVLWDSARMPMAGHIEEVNAVATAPDGRTVGSVAKDGRITLWDPETRTPRAVLTADDRPVTALSYHPAGGELATAHDDGVGRIWDTGTGRVVHTLTGHTDRLLAIAYGPGGRLVATGSVDRTVRLWDGTTGKPLARLSHPEQVESVVFSADGATAVSASMDGTVIVWDVAGRTPRATLHDRPLRKIAVTRDAGLVAVGRADGTVGFWRPGESGPYATLTAHAGPVERLAFSPDETLLATGGLDETARLWSMPKRRAWATLAGFPGGIGGLAWSQDGRRLYTGHGDHTVTLWALDPAQARRYGCQNLAVLLPGRSPPGCPGTGAAHPA